MDVKKFASNKGVQGGLAVIIVAIAAFLFWRQPETPKSSQTITEQEARQRFASMPLAFQRNDGQVDEQVKFFVRAGSQSIFFTPQEIAYAFVENIEGQAEGEAITEEKPEPRRALAVKQSFVGANADPVLEGVRQLKGKVNYFIGNDPEKWRTEIPTYEGVSFTGLYDGVDVVYTGRNGALNYEFTIQPHAAPSIQVFLDGIEGLSISSTGDLVVETAFGAYGLQKPLAYQMAGTEQRAVSASYVVIGNNTYGFSLGEYDPSKPLIITQ